MHWDRPKSGSVLSDRLTFELYVTYAVIIADNGGHRSSDKSNSGNTNSSVQTLIAAIQRSTRGNTQISDSNDDPSELENEMFYLIPAAGLQPLDLASFSPTPISSNSSGRRDHCR